MKPYYDEDGITIYHGDCREILPELDVEFVLTDPPYGIDFNTDYTRFSQTYAPSRKWEKVKGDSIPFDPAPLLALDTKIAMFGANHFIGLLPEGKWVVWNKRDFNNSGVPMSDGEMVWHNCGGKPIRVFNWYWNGAWRKGEFGTAYHPTQKPIELMKYLIDELSGDLNVVDPFMGSGSTLVAAKGLGRRAVGIEIEEKYCEIAVQRLAQGVLEFG